VSGEIAAVDVLELLNTAWRGLTGRVMGGIPRETASHEVIDQQTCVRLTGDVRLDVKLSRRLGLVAIGRAFNADLAVSGAAFYR